MTSQSKKTEYILNKNLKPEYNKRIPIKNKNLNHIKYKLMDLKKIKFTNNTTSYYSLF